MSWFLVVWPDGLFFTFHFVALSHSILLSSLWSNHFPAFCRPPDLSSPLCSNISTCGAAAGKADTPEQHEQSRLTCWKEERTELLLMVRLWAAKLQPSIVETPTVRIKYDEKHETMWSYYPSVSTAPQRLLRRHSTLWLPQSLHTLIYWWFLIRNFTAAGCDRLTLGRVFPEYALQANVFSCSKWTVLVFTKVGF